jgi:hypothetical protein
MGLDVSCRVGPLAGPKRTGYLTAAVAEVPGLEVEEWR